MGTIHKSIGLFAVILFSMITFGQKDYFKSYDILKLCGLYPISDNKDESQWIEIIQSDSTIEIVRRIHISSDFILNDSIRYDKITDSSYLTYPSEDAAIYVFGGCRLEIYKYKVDSIFKNESVSTVKLMFPNVTYDIHFNYFDSVSLFCDKSNLYLPINKCEQYFVKELKNDTVYSWWAVRNNDCFLVKEKDAYLNYLNKESLSEYFVWKSESFCAAKVNAEFAYSPNLPDTLVLNVSLIRQELLNFLE